MWRQRDVTRAGRGDASSGKERQILRRNRLESIYQIFIAVESLLQLGVRSEWITWGDVYWLANCSFKYVMGRTSLLLEILRTKEADLTDAPGRQSS